MQTLSVWKFSTPDGAANAEATLLDLRSQGLIEVEDAAVASWPMDAKKPRTTQLHGMAGRGALAGTFWGFLFGLLFFVPLLGAAVGAAAGALSGSLSDVGIDDQFIRKVRDQLTPGTSALFVLSSNAVRDKVREAFAGRVRAELIATNLSQDEENKLHDLFAA